MQNGEEKDESRGIAGKFAERFSKMGIPQHTWRREYLQSDEFKERFADLIPYLAKVKKNNSNGEQTEDLFFLLSKEEFDPEETPYEFYENKANRVKFTEDGNTCSHWTRSAYRGSSYLTWYVSSDGSVNHHGYANWAIRCAPACTIA